MSCCAQELTPFRKCKRIDPLTLTLSPVVAGERGLLSETTLELPRSADQPQHRDRPFLVSIESTPATGLSVMRVAPVSKNCRPCVLGGSLPVAIASSAIEAILWGYCCEVAPITPAATFLTPGQPPSIDTIMTLPSSLPAAFKASHAPAAAGSLIV